MTKRKYERTAALLNAQPRATYRRSQKQVVVPWRWLAAAAVLIALLLWVWLDPQWYVDATRLQIAGSATVETAREAALGSEALGMHGGWLRAGDIVSRVLQVGPAVLDAEADCRFYPAQCVITVQERVPVLVWATEAGLRWVAKDGVIFPARGARPDLPLVSGALPDEGAVSTQVLDGVHALVDLGLPPEALEYHQERGLVWHDPEGRAVAFGSGAEMRARWAIYQALIADLDARGIFPWTVDVRFPDAPTYSLERAW